MLHRALAEEHPTHDGGGDEEQRQRQDHVNHLGLDTRLKLQRCRPCAHRSHEQSRGDRRDRVGARQQSDGDAVEAEPRVKGGLESAGDAKGLHRATHAGQSAADRHREKDRLLHTDAGVVRGARVEAHRVEAEALRCSSKKPTEEERNEERNHETGRNDTELRQGRRVSNGWGARQRLVGLLKGLARQVVHQCDRDRVEHDCCDDFRHASVGAQYAGDRSPRSSAQDAESDGEGKVNDRRHLEVVTGPGRADGPYEKLSLRADVEQPGAQSNGESKSGQDQRGRLLHYRDQAIDVTEGGGEQDPISRQGVDSLDVNQQPTDSQSKQHRHDRCDDDLRP